jgi:antitoxin (DNA-binding transcriptional repressor) of toxin-antitoxin stability system
MRRLELTEATASLAQYAQELQEEPIIVTKDDKPVAALFALGDSDWETISLSLNPLFLDILDRSRARRRAEGGISQDEIERRFGIAPVDSGY